MRMKLDDALQLIVEALTQRMAESEQQLASLNERSDALRDRIARLEGAHDRRAWRRGQE